MIHVLGLGAGMYILNHFISLSSYRGPSGEDGNDGSDGERGLLGHKGEQGMRGERGLLGRQGEQGMRGEQGAKGERGEQGVRGEQGDLKECKVDQKVNLVSDRLSKHIRDIPSTVREVLMSKETGEIMTLKMVEERGVVSEELRKQQAKDRPNMFKEWYLNLWRKLMGTSQAKREEKGVAAEEKGVAAEELKRIRAELENRVYHPPPLASGVIVDWKKESQP